MSSAGHVMDMIRRMKANRELLKAKRSRHSIIKGMYKKPRRGDSIITNPLDNLSESQLVKIRKDIQTKLAADRKRSYIKLAIAIVILLALAAWLMMWVFGR